MKILIGIILYLVAVTLFVALARVLKGCDDGMTQVMTKTVTGHKRRMYHPARRGLRELRS